ncbi:hypothetical protein ACFQ22_13040 [Lentilactobacillus raoultii]|uniref:Uncharacterized protein n=1 Tax=Lentilactobacillus raoultii TaxID=1987503 RepID=A0ABW3PK87_9LACO|nr:hypothetical protein [Lentilactobacillus raoultii]
MQNNQIIRRKISDERLKMWEVANEIGIADSTFSKWLRLPLSSARYKRVEKAINELTKERDD